MKRNIFSVIIPYYNTNIDQFKFCLESLICQDLNLLKEIIIVNDGSDDEHSKEIKKLIDELNLNSLINIQSKEKLIKLINQNNQGSAGARKTGFDKSTGNIILFVDSDDWICDSKWIFKLNDYFINNSSIELIQFKTINVFNQNDYLIPKKLNKNEIIKFDLSSYLNNTTKSTNNFSICAYAYKKELLERNSNFFNFINEYYEDAYWNSVLLSKKWLTLIVNEIFYCYRVNNINSKTYKANSSNNILKTIQIYTKWFTSFDDWNIEKFSDARDYWIYWFVYICVCNLKGLRNGIKFFEKNQIIFPTIKEIKKFFKKYKPYKGFKLLFIKSCLLSKYLDYFLNKIYMFFKKRKINL
ncbi:glycosyltransferase family 2 protein [Mycoplasmoides pirum]|uniref:glycosyltransferase family 2 protein n=2 Tax=Mycoplasmoides pirum TaxID=2122 RepID=UPI00047F5910|nr:glycosyltransferase family A protein [Mycoplasmoides pirum]